MYIRVKVAMEKSVLALGYFDAIHKGHRLLLQTAKEIANNCGCSLIAGTFDDNLYQKLGKGSNNNIFLLEERKNILHSLGVNKVVVFPTTDEFLNMSQTDFTNFIMKFNPYCVVVGSDYSFGKNATGDAFILQKILSEKNVIVKIIDLVIFDNKKISTRDIRFLLEKGAIQQANNLLGFDYFLTGRVVSNRQVGRLLGFPTANINIPANKFIPKLGVYSSIIEIDGFKYKSVTNIGAHPTFNDKNVNIECFIFDFDKKIYGNNITLFPKKYLREIKKFTSEKQLAKQIEKDIEKAKGDFNND